MLDKPPKTAYHDVIIMLSVKSAHRTSRQFLPNDPDIGRDILRQKGLTLKALSQALQQWPTEKEG